MNAPDLKKLRWGFHWAVLILTFVQVAPSSIERAWNVWISLFAGSLRFSYEIACKWPLSSAAMEASYWSWGAGAPLAVTLMNLAWVQCLPKSLDCWNEMSAPDVAMLMLF